MDVHKAFHPFYTINKMQCYGNSCIQCFPLRKFYTRQIIVLVSVDILKLS